MARPVYDWDSIVPKANALLESGATLYKTSVALGVSYQSLVVKLQQYKLGMNTITKQVSTGNEFQLVQRAKIRISNPLETPEKADLESAKNEARKLLFKLAHGQDVEVSPVQMQAVKLLLAKELEPDEKENPYSDVPDKELVDRLLTTACSLIGVQAVQKELERLKLLGQLDVLMKGQPVEFPDLPKAVVDTGANTVDSVENAPVPEMPPKDMGINTESGPKEHE